MSSNNIKINSKDLGKVKKLAYIVTLDDMLKSYDELKQVDDDYTARTGTSVSELTDAIIEKLTNLVNSERTLTCRNVLIANYQTMTDPQYWLGHKLFADLPKDASDALHSAVPRISVLSEPIICGHASNCKQRLAHRAGEDKGTALLPFPFPLYHSLIQYRLIR